jgi:D-amino peptidase
MKIFISADIEGVAGISHWDEASLHKPDFSIFQEQMTAEVNAACEGALEAGATEIWVKDGHGTGRNLLASRLPPPTRLIRGWSGHPYQMLQELDETFSAVVMIGYHAAAGAAGNPLSHALTKDLAELRINGRHASEFLLNAYTAALLKVPVALVSGDQALCDDVVALNPSIQTVPVKIGVGDSTVSLHPGEAVRRIREQVAHALRTDLTSCGLDLPEQFRVELRYKEHTDAYRNAFYPGAKLKDACIIVFETPDYFEVLRFLLFTA